jgi:PAS domain S-box-containing protein
MKPRKGAADQAFVADHALAEAIPQQVWTATPDGTLDFVNRRMVEYFARPNDELLRIGWRDFLHPDDVERCAARWDAALASGEPYEIEFRIRRGDDSAYRWHLGRALPVRGDDGSVVKWFGTNTDIDDQKGIESALRASEDRLAESEHRYRQILDSVQDMVFVKARGSVVVYANKATCAYYGLSLEELRTDYSKGDDPTLVEQYLRDDARVFETGETVEVAEEPNRRRDGEVRIFHTIKTPIFDADGGVAELVGVSRDITDRKRTEEITEFLPEASAILSSSLDLDVTLSNVARLVVPRAADWMAVDVLTGEVIHRVTVHHVDPAKVELGWKLHRQRPPTLSDATGVGRVIATGTAEVVPEVSEALLEATGADEEARAVVRQLGLRAYMMLPLIASGHTLGAITLVYSESGRRIGDAEIAFAEELARRASYAVENARLFREAEESIRAREDLIAVVSQDLKAPLTTLLNDAGLLVRTLPSDVRIDRQKLDSIRNLAERMQGFVHTLLDLEQIRAGRIAIDRTPQDPTALVLEALELNRAAARDRGIMVMRDTPPRLSVSCDRRRVVQVISRLLGNAITLTPKGGRIVLRVAQHDSETAFAVVDGGRPFTAEQLSHLFDRNFRLREGEAEVTGLGFAVCKGIVEAHGGRLSVERDPAGSNAYLFTIPAALSPRPRLVSLPRGR